MRRRLIAKCPRGTSGEDIEGRDSACMALRYACKAADCGKGMVIKMIKVITVDDEAPIRAWILSLLK